MGEVQAPMVERKKKNTLDKMVENLGKDEATLTQLLETSNTLRQPHQPLSSLLKDMLSEVRQSISDKKAELENLPLLHSRVDLMCYNSLPPTQYSIIFPSQKIRNSWEEDFLKVKRSTCSPLLAAPHSSRSSPQPSDDGGFEFLHPLHVQSGRAGMELSCAGVGLPGDGASYHNLWVACCDGYGGQVCLLDLETSTRPHMVANITVSDSKILCISAIPVQDSDNDRPSTALSLESDGLSTNLDVPLEDGSDNLDVPLEDRTVPVVSPELVGKVTQSMPRDIRGSLITSFSSDSSSTTPSLSRSPSLTSTRSDPRTDPTDDVIPIDPAPIHQIAFGGHEDGSPRKRNGFHRVCSNSAPDLLKVVAADVSPTEEGFRRRGERGATSLSPPPPIDPKYWKMRSPPIVEGLTKEESGVEEGRGSSMWLGTEGGQILVYHPGSNLRSRSNRCTIQLPASVHCIR
ncbi:Rho guanine nucleotide exchange factor 17 [Geodia barretti]|nr:Rho guanine nucleotide exchange factor 17 [Geodia barretti]